MKTSKKDVKVTRINTGIYKITSKRKVFQARKNLNHGQWELYEVFQTSETNPIGREEWMQTYVDLRSCKICVQNLTKN